MRQGIHISTVYICCDRGGGDTVYPVKRGKGYDHIYYETGGVGEGVTMILHTVKHRGLGLGKHSYERQAGRNILGHCLAVMAIEPLLE